MPKSLAKILCCKAWRHLETPVFQKTSVRHDSVNMGIKIQEITIGVYGNTGPGCCIVIQDG